MVHIYLTHTSALPDPVEHPEVLALLPSSRREKILRCARVEDRKRSFGAGLLLRAVLLRYGISPDSVCTDTNGKPHAEGLCFSLSHSGAWAACAVGQSDVGCDIERLAPAREGVIRRAFCPEETRYLNTFAGAERDRAFFRLWTMKESYLKMTGEGIRLGLRRVMLQPGEPVRLYRDGELVSCHLHEYTLPGYCLSVCAREGVFAPEAEIIDADVLLR